MAIRLHQITKQGLEEIKKERDYINTVEVPENSIALAEARALGDLSENSEYQAAQAKKKELDHRLAELEDIINYHEIIEEEWYTIRYDDLGVQKEIQLVGVLESDPEKNMISRECPLGKAILGRKINETVTFTSGSGKKITVTIISKGKIKK